MKKLIIYILALIPILGFSQAQDQGIYKELILIDYLIYWDGAAYDTVVWADFGNIYGKDGTIDADRSVNVDYNDLLFYKADDWMFTSSYYDRLTDGEGLHWTLFDKDTIKSADTLFIYSSYKTEIESNWVEITADKIDMVGPVYYKQTSTATDSGYIINNAGTFVIGSSNTTYIGASNGIYIGTSGAGVGGSSIANYVDVSPSAFRIRDATGSTDIFRVNTSDFEIIFDEYNTGYQIGFHGLPGDSMVTFNGSVEFLGPVYFADEANFLYSLGIANYSYESSGQVVFNNGSGVGTLMKIDSLNTNNWIWAVDARTVPSATGDSLTFVNDAGKWSFFGATVDSIFNVGESANFESNVNVEGNLVSANMTDTDEDIEIAGDWTFEGDLTTEVKTTDVSNPPTDAELDAAYGTPATVGSGWRTLIDDNGAGSNFYEVISDGTNWWIFTGTKAS